MYKLFVILGSAVAAGAASLALGLASGNADPGSNNSTYNVIGEPYAKAVAILRAQGVKATFGGSVGSDVPQAQCVVASEKVVSSHIQLSLDCTAEAQPQQPATAGTSGATTSGAPATETARPTPGAPGVVTVVPTRVG